MMDIKELEQTIKDRITKAKEKVEIAEKEKDLVTQAVQGGKIIAYKDVLMIMDVI